MGRVDTFPQSTVTTQPSTVLGYAEVTADQASIGTAATDLTGLYVTVTVPAGRRLRITGFVPAFYGNTATGFLEFDIYEGATRLSLNQHALTATGQQFGMSVERIISPSAGTHTYKLAALVTSGTMSLGAGAGYPAFIRVEDITGYTNIAPVYAVPVGLLAQSANNLSLAGFAGSAGAPVDVPGSSLTVTVPAGRTLRINATGRFGANTTSGHIVGDILEDGVVIGRFNNSDVVAGATIQAMNSVLTSPSAGTHTYKLQVYKYNGGNTADLSYGRIWIEDVTPTPAPAGSAPSSQLGYAESSVDQAGITTAETTATGLSVSVTVPAGRRLKVTLHLSFSAVVANQSAITRIYQDGVPYRRDTPVTTPTSTVFEWSHVYTPAAGTHSYGVSVAASTGTFTLQAGSFILVEDITGVSIPANNYVTAPVVDATGSANAEGVSAAVARADHVHRGGIAVVTSTTRPASPYLDQVIEETDTGLQKKWNGSNWVTQANFKMFNVGSALTGSPPAIDTGSIPFKMQCGTIVRVTNAGGGTGPISYPTPFPNGVLCVMAINGDAGATDLVVCAMYNMNVNDFEIIAMNLSTHGRYANATLRFNWIAIGW